MGVYFENLGLSICYTNAEENLPNEAFWSICGSFNFCSKAVADYVIAKIRKFPKESWVRTDKLVWNMINCLDYGWDNFNRVQEL